MSNNKAKFDNILVAVDLADEHRLVGEALPLPTEEAIRQAEWVAQANHARLSFVCVLPSGAEQLSYDRQILMAARDEYKSVVDHAGEVLSGVAERSSRKGIRTQTKIVQGKSWVELIREAEECAADLVVAGTRRQGAFRSMLLGSTGIKLLRKCPCPVWITKPAPQHDDWIDSVLVAHELTPVGEHALQLAAMISQRRNAQFHVVHSIEPSELPDDQLTADQANATIARQLTELGCDVSQVQISVVDEPPADAILANVEKNDIQLVVMGTVARAGISGILVGNTAEKLLPFLPCSVLAVKPDVQ